MNVMNNLLLGVLGRGNVSSSVLSAVSSFKLPSICVQWLKSNNVQQPLVFMRRVSSVLSSAFVQSAHVQMVPLSVLAEGERTLCITWDDGGTSRFHSVWLRHNCHCSNCRQPHSGQRLVDPASLSLQTTIRNVRPNGNCVEMDWCDGDGLHSGYVSVSHLRRHCYEEHSLMQRRQNVTLGPPAKAIPTISYDELENSCDGVLRWLRQIHDVGISLLTGVPIIPQDGVPAVQKVAEYIGPVENLIYGETFDVVTTEKPINIAYSTAALDFHMDLVYYESPPGLQFLHCLRFDDCVQGGESRFVDAFHVAETFRRQHPEKFMVLTRVPATFQKIHYDREMPVEMIYRRPHLLLNHHQELVAVTWAPAFEGPLSVQSDDVERYYEAYALFAKAIINSTDIVEYRLRKGDLVAFNNRRMLHGRNAFHLNGEKRHLKGCYVNIDHFKSKLSVLSKLQGARLPVKRVGNQDWT